MDMFTKLKHEVTAVIRMTLWFTLWPGVLVSFKHPVFEKYQTAFTSLPIASAGALVVAKAMPVLEHVP